MNNEKKRSKEERYKILNPPIKRTKLAVNVHTNDSDHIYSGYLVEASDAYVHILDDKDDTLSHMIPWHRIHEINIFEIEE